LPTGETTISKALHDVGYATGIIGKWHLGGTAVYHPQRKGYDEFSAFFTRDIIMQIPGGMALPQCRVS